MAYSSGEIIKKKCPQCGSKAVKLYQNKSIAGKRKWISISWYCTECGHTYKVARDTLIYPVGKEPYDESFNEKCPKCEKKLVRVYRHINPKNGKQKWVSKGWYCERCKYIWMDEKKDKEESD